MHNKYRVLLQRAALAKCATIPVAIFECSLGKVLATLKIRTLEPLETDLVGAAVLCCYIQV